MNDHSTTTPSPVPGPLCAVFSPLLPLLDSRALPPEHEASLLDHLADCAWCQNQRAAYMVVEEALRRHYASIPSTQALTLEDIMRASQSNLRPGASGYPTTREELYPSDLSYLPELSELGRSASPGGNRGRSRTALWTTLGAVAAAVLIVGLAAALFGGLGPRTPGGAPAATCTAVLQGTAPAATIAGFPDLTFPTGAVMTTVKSSLGGPSRFTILETDACYTGTEDDLTGPAGTHHSVTANLLGAGWAVSASFPYQGALLQPCLKPNLCYQSRNTRYLALDRIITEDGTGIITYHLRLAAPPAAPTCNANFTNSPIQGVQTSVEGVPLPPITRVVPDDAAGLRGYNLCSSGSVASITAFLDTALPATGWGKAASDPRCFFQDECWTKGSTAISWNVGDPTDWQIAYHQNVGP